MTAFRANFSVIPARAHSVLARILLGGGYKCLGYSPLRFSRFSRLWKEAA